MGMTNPAARCVCLRVHLCIRVCVRVCVYVCAWECVYLSDRVCSVCMPTCVVGFGCLRLRVPLPSLSHTHSQFHCLNDVVTRELPEAVMDCPDDNTRAVCPADCRVSVFASIADGTRAHGLTFDAPEDLFGDLPRDITHKFKSVRSAVCAAVCVCRVVGLLWYVRVAVCVWVCRVVTFL